MDLDIYRLFYITAAWPPVGLSMPTSVSFDYRAVAWGRRWGWMTAWTQQHESWLNYNSVGVKVGLFPFFKPCGVNYFYQFFFCSVYNVQNSQHRKERRDLGAKFWLARKGHAHLMSPYVKSGYVLTHQSPDLISLKGKWRAGLYQRQTGTHRTHFQC